MHAAHLPRGRRGASFGLEEVRVPRSIWTGAISFGLVNVPVKLFSAIQRKEVRFNLFHASDAGRIRQRRVCSLDGEEVPWEEVAKGYPVTRRRYVMVSKEELEGLDPRATRTIDILDFVELHQIDPIFYEHTYYVAPANEGAARAYTLLLEAMRRQGRVGIARFVMRTKQYLAALRPMGDVLALSTMQYVDEIRSPAELEELPGKVKPSARELEMAERLVESLSTDWQPERYRDEYRERVLELIERKAQGEEIELPAERPALPAPVDLAEALRASLAARGGEAPAAQPRRRRRAQRAAPRGRKTAGGGGRRRTAS